MTTLILVSLISGLAGLLVAELEHRKQERIAKQRLARRKARKQEQK